MKLLLPLLVVTFFVTACSSPDASRRPLWRAWDSGGSGRSRPLFGAAGGEGYSDLNATRRDLYSPSVASGPYTRSLDDASWRNHGQPIDQEMQDRRDQQRINEIQTKTPPKAQ